MEGTFPFSNSWKVPRLPYPRHRHTITPHSQRMLRAEFIRDSTVGKIALDITKMCAVYNPSFPPPFWCVYSRKKAQRHHGRLYLSGEVLD